MHKGTELHPSSQVLEDAGLRSLSVVRVNLGGPTWSVRPQFEQVPDWCSTGDHMWQMKMQQRDHLRLPQPQQQRRRRRWQRLDEEAAAVAEAG